jgi:ABC-type antimicrobial peptide transport system permease subunit
MKLSLPVRRSAKLRYDNQDFWVSLMPGLLALAVFVSAAIFLFYYVEPNGIVSEVGQPIDPTQQIPGAIDQPVTVDDVIGAPPLDADSSSHGEIVSNFSPSLMTSFLFAGAVVAGFLVYVLVRYRSSDVLPVEHDST